MEKTQEIEKILAELKEMLKERLMLPYDVNEIDEDALIFDTEGLEDTEKDLPTLGLDSVDGLEIMVGIQSLYHVKLDAEKHPEAYRTVRSLAEEVYNLIHEKVCEE